MAFLRIMSGDVKGKKFDVDRDEVVVGRAPENVVTIEDPAVSSHHCAVLRAGKRFTLKDMNSTNGTRLNNVLVKEHRLSPKDVITEIGRASCRERVYRLV
jgi:pSer/pThr/pTyr-binding forkhead associated (FHA) protein